MKKNSITSNKLCCFALRIEQKFLMVMLLPVLLSACQAGESCQKMLNTKCVQCHSISTSCEKLGQSEDWWLRTIDGMIKLGADISKQDRKVIAECLSNPPESKFEKICK